MKVLPNADALPTELPPQGISYKAIVHLERLHPSLIFGYLPGIRDEGNNLSVLQILRRNLSALLAVLAIRRVVSVTLA